MVLFKPFGLNMNALILPDANLTAHYFSKNKEAKNPNKDMTNMIKNKTLNP